MTAATTTTTPEAAKPPPLSAEALAKRRRQQREQMVWTVWASYVLDFVLLSALSAADALPFHEGLLYFMAGSAVSLFFLFVLRSDWSNRFEDHYLAGPQMLLHAVVNLAFTVYAPHVGVLMLMLLFVLFSFGALRVNPRSIGSAPLIGAVSVGLAVVAVMVWMGETLSLPSATWPQRLWSGMWIALVLCRGTLVGVYSANLRTLLNQRNGELAATFEKLDLMASRDDLTGALNRRSVMRFLDEERQRMLRTGQPFGVALFDIDHFKQVNDSFGHIVGDEALRRFTHGATVHMRATDRLGRYGGEEFLMLFSGTEDVDAARKAAERVRESTEQHDWSAVAPNLKVTVSAGVAVCLPGETTSQLLGRADQALYVAKRDGRNRVHVSVS